MSTFNAVTCWLLWVVTALFWLAFLFIRVVNAIPRAVIAPEHAESYTKLFWVSLAILTAFFCAAHFAIRRFWHRAGRAPGFGFWLVSIVYYLCAMFIPASGFAPYFAVGDRSALQWVSLMIGALFLFLSFPTSIAPDIYETKNQ